MVCDDVELTLLVDEVYKRYALIKRVLKKIKILVKIRNNLG